MPGSRNSVGLGKSSRSKRLTEFSLPGMRPRDRQSVRTLVLLRRDDQILLGLKKRGFGAGHWNGFGGKLVPGETIRAAAKREVMEECGVHVSRLQQCGRLFFTFAHDPLELDVHVFTTSQFTGEPGETEEMKPQWFALAEIPYDQMWADDKHWFPHFLAGQAFVGRFHFADANTIAQFTVKEVAPASKAWHIPSVT